MSDAGHHHDGPPTLPEVTDEAGNTPTWVPLTGIGLLALIAVVIVFRAQLAADAPAVDAPAAEAVEAADGVHADAPTVRADAPTEAAH